MEHILVLSLSDLASDPRPHRQLRFLQDRFRVTAAGLGDPRLERVAFVPLALSSRTRRRLRYATLPLGRYERYYWGSREVQTGLTRLADVHPDLVVANDIDTLPLALEIAKGAPVIFDAHEYAPRERDGDWLWKFVFASYRSYLCRTYIPRVTGMITVCPTIAETYTRDTGVTPIVMTSAPDFEDLEPIPHDGRRPVRLVHHGIAHRHRRLETMIRMMDQLGDGFTLDFLLKEYSRDYLAQLRQRAAGNPRIRFLEPVPMRELSRFLNQYDVGLYILEPRSFNDRCALPNKFFEFIQARLAIAIGPSPEMERYVRKYDLGIVARDFTPEAMAEELRTLSPGRLNDYKRRSHAAARELSSGPNKQKFLALVDQALRSRPCAASQPS
jgi:hypothetical protein